MASTAKVLSCLPVVRAIPSVRSIHPVAPPPARRERSATLQLLRDSLGGALLLAASIALWTATWAAVAGPLSPAAQTSAAAVAAAAAEP